MIMANILGLIIIIIMTLLINLKASAMNNQEKQSSIHDDHVAKQIENAKAGIDQEHSVKPGTELKSQENSLNGLSEEERAQAAESNHQTLVNTDNDLSSSASGTVSGGLTEQERSEAAAADGSMDQLNNGLSDDERREAADESW